MKTKPTVAAPILLTAVFLLCAMIRLIPQNAFGEGNNPYVSVSLLQLAVFAVPALIFMKLRSDGYTKSFACGCRSSAMCFSRSAPLKF